MNCKDFRELADSYLSDELAVETNHDILAHLEKCADCCDELAVRRTVRQKTRLALTTAAEFQIDPSFSAGLKMRLRENAESGAGRFGWKLLAPALATLLIFASFGFVLLHKQSENSDILRAHLVEMSHKAIGDHEHCALAKLKRWEANAGKVAPEKTVFVKSLQTPETEILEAHDCLYEGKVFTHYILRRGTKIISVQKLASEVESAANKTADRTIISEREEGLQVASFHNSGNLIYVISDLSEAENLSVARTLSDSLKPEA